MLSEIYTVAKLKEVLADAWHPYPKARERERWDALPEGLRQVYVARGESVLDQEWSILSASLFLDFARTGNRTRFQAERNKRRNALGQLLLAECVEGKGRFLDQIVNGVWATCEETYWGVPAHLSLQEAGRGLPDAAEPTVDLFAAETSALLAWTHYLIDKSLDDVSPLVRPRIELEIDRRMLTPLLEREDFWWMGLKPRPDGRRVNNWNPWINSNWLTSFLLIERDRDRRAEGVAKSVRSLDQFIEPYPVDGGCDEGAGYWGRAGASLFDCLEMLESATGESIDLFGSEQIRNMGSFIYKANIHERYFVNFADAPVLTIPVPSILFRFGKRVDDEQLVAQGAWFAEHGKLSEKGFDDSVARQLPALFTSEELFRTSGEQPLPRDAWFPDLEVAMARIKEGSAEGFFVAAKGGTNAESHNHNDVGNFVVFTEGKPLLIDTGVEPYTAKNSSPQRYDIWTMNSNHHNLPEVNGQTQQPGFEFAAKEVTYEHSEDRMMFTLDISDAYPSAAGLESCKRTVSLERDSGVTIEDSANFASNGATVVMHLMTACDVEVADGKLKLNEAPMTDGRVTGKAEIVFDASAFEVSTEEISLVDGERLHTVWGPRLVRVVMEAASLPRSVLWSMHITNS
ncbi:heparinase II/III-family protein [bacterium]|nr:heparinase II/III-family protein [bacterium]